MENRFDRQNSGLPSYAISPEQLALPGECLGMVEVFREINFYEIEQQPTVVWNSATASIQTRVTTQKHLPSS